MGPEATARFYQDIVKLCQEKYGAKIDSEFPKMFIYNCPALETIGKETKKEVAAALKDGMQKLLENGADFIAVPCNTVTDVAKSVTKDLPVPLLNPIEATVQQAKKLGYKKIGLLATSTTVKNRLYEAAAAKAGIKIILPSAAQQKSIDKVILNILAGTKSAQDKKQLLEIIDALASKGCQAAVLGCTDLPILVEQRDSELPLLDSLALLAKVCVKMAYGGEKNG